MKKYEIRIQGNRAVNEEIMNGIIDRMSKKGFAPILLSSYAESGLAILFEKP